MIKVSNELFSYPDHESIRTVMLMYDAVQSDTDKYREQLVEPGLALQYKGDFYGLLMYYSLELRLFLPTLYLNGYTSPYEYDGEGGVIKIAGEINLPRY